MAIKKKKSVKATVCNVFLIIYTTELQTDSLKQICTS